MAVGLFAITGPIAGLPVFVAATKGQTVKEQNKTTLILATTYVTAGLIALFAGNALLTFFGISVAALRAAGMAVIATIGWKMMNAPTPEKDKAGVDATGHIKPEAEQLHPPTEKLYHAASNMKVASASTVSLWRVPTPSEIGIVPLGFPMYAGPGALSIIITWSSEYKAIYLPAAAAILANALIIIAFNFLANPITRLVGAQGLLVTEKVFGLIVLAIAVSGMASSLTVLFPGLNGTAH